MTLILLFTALAIVALGSSVLVQLPKAGRIALVVLSGALLLLGLALGSSVVVDNQEVGIIKKQFGKALPTGQIIARNGEMGPQAEILGPGWHFGYLPFIYSISLNRVVSINPGEVGFVTARDGLPLPENETFAPEWPSAQDMLNPVTFLAKGGQRGPQTTILTPGTYRYNTALHEVSSLPALQVDAGTVVVIKSNTGKVWQEAEGKAMMVNGVPLVPKGFRGIWSEPITPGGYYLNTRAFSPIVMKTTQRVYTYQASTGNTPPSTTLRQASTQSARGDSRPRAMVQAPQVQTSGSHPGNNVDWSVTVRAKDGFQFPVDVRVSCFVEAANAPYLVALLGNPDAIVQDEQEGDALEVLEARLVLPSIRAIFRNVAETMSALEFVNRRSEIEAIAMARVKTELAKHHVTVDGLFVGNIHLDATEAGQKLLNTQTDREVALNQQKLFEQQKQAEESRAKFVRAQEEAEQQRNLAAAEYKVRIERENALAQAAKAKGDSDYQIITGEGRAQAYRKLVDALGRDQVAQIELLKLVVEGKVQITPQVMVTGGTASNTPGAIDAMIGTVLRQSVQPSQAPAK